MSFSSMSWVTYYTPGVGHKGVNDNNVFISSERLASIHCLNYFSSQDVDLGLNFHSLDLGLKCFSPQVRAVSESPKCNSSLLQVNARMTKKLHTEVFSVFRSSTNVIDWKMMITYKNYRQFEQWKRKIAICTCKQGVFEVNTCAMFFVY